MKQGVLPAVFLLLAVLPSCSPQAPVTLPPSQEAPTASATSVPTPTVITATTTPQGTSTTPTITAPVSALPALPPPSLPSMDAFMKGIYFNDWGLFDPLHPPPPPPGGATTGPIQPLLGRRLYTPPESDQSLKNLAATGANWIALSVRVGQETISSTKISRSENATATDAELRHVIDLAHSLGIRVLLMPLLHLSNDPTHGHIYIASTFNSETQWQEWFASYREFINYYANFSQEAGVDMFFIGNELGATTHREEDWRRVIREIRLRYKGPITYDSLCSGFSFPHGEDMRIKWWDAVDYIGVGGYYPLTNKNAPIVAELKKAWTDKGYLDELESLSVKFNKPIIISEIGYQSKDGANKIPAYFNLVASQDLQEQADCYQAAFEVLWGKPWLKGIFWFQWFSNPRPVEQGGINSVNENPYGKPAEEVIKKYYLSQPSTPASPPTPTPTPTTSRPLPPMDASMKGISFAAWRTFDSSSSGLYTSPGADQSLRNLAATGANWINLVVVFGQETIASTTMFRKPPATATDTELKRMIDLAHSLGMRVMLNPRVRFSNDSAHWWGQIGTAFTRESQWQEWFSSYREAINYYAAFAQNSGVDMLAIGQELGSTTHREKEWRQVIQEVRAQFKGPITYMSLCSSGGSYPHGEDQRITWWDALDYIGVDVWYKLTDKNDPTVEELKAAWNQDNHIWLLERLYKQYNKAIIFTEIGYPSIDGANKQPAGPTGYLTGMPIDLQEQADCYQAALEVFTGKPWMAGMFWWQWRAESGFGGPNDNNVYPNGKPAEEVLKKYYLSQPSPVPSPTTMPQPTQTPPLPSMDAFMKGMAFDDWAWPTMPRPPMYGPLYYPPQADASLKKLADTGANWISLLIMGTQESFKSTRITRDEYKTASDEALKHVIKYANSLGMRVTLHPALFSLPNSPGISWIEIGTAFTSETQWQEWFTSYREFINHYASFAEESGVDIFYVGSELPGTTHREEDWRRIVKEVRERYNGPIAYDSVFWGNPTPEYKRIKWWDAVDYIAVDCWYSLTKKNDPTVAELKEGLIRTGYITDLENISKQFTKPVIISEIGYSSFDGTNVRPWDNKNTTNAPIDLQEQADCYQAALEVLWGKPWLKGIFWWHWSAISMQTPWWLTPHGRPAEDVLKKYYLEKPK